MSPSNFGLSPLGPGGNEIVEGPGWLGPVLGTRHRQGETCTVSFEREELPPT